MVPLLDFRESLLTMLQEGATCIRGMGATGGGENGREWMGQQLGSYEDMVLGGEKRARRVGAGGGRFI